MNRRSSPLTVVSLIVLVALINAPVVHSFYVDQRVQAVGKERDAEIVRVTEQDGRTFIQFDLGTEGEQDVWAAEIQRDRADDVREGGTVRVTVVPDHPAQHRVEGQYRSRVPLVLTLVVDLLLVLGFIVYRRFRRARWRPVELDALADLARTREPAGMVHEHGDVWVARGEIEQIEDDRVVIDTGDKLVTVHLAGFANPARHQQPVSARGRLRP